MAQDAKYGKVEIPGIPDDEPVFIIRGKDVSAPDAIIEYGHAARHLGATEEFCQTVNVRADEIAQWQKANAHVVKTPD